MWITGSQLQNRDGERIDIHYHTNDGRIELAIYEEITRGNSKSKVLYFQSACLVRSQHTDSYLEQVKPEYRQYFEEIVALHPDARYARFHKDDVIQIRIEKERSNEHT